MFFVMQPDMTANGLVDGGDGIESVCEGPDIQTGAAYHHYGRCVSEKLRRPLQREVFKGSGVDGIGDGVSIDKVMRNGFELSGCRLGHADIQFPVALMGV